MGRVRTRSRSRQQEPDDHGLFYWERWRHGSTYGWQLLHSTYAYHRRRSSKTSSETLVWHSWIYRRYRWYQYPIRSRSQDWPGSCNRNQPSNFTILGISIQGYRVSYCLRILSLGRGAYNGWNSLLAGWDAREIYPIWRLCGSKILTLGVWKVRGSWRQTRHSDARCGWGYEHWKNLQGSFPEVYPLTGRRSLWPWFCQGLSSEVSGRADVVAGWTIQWEAVYHVWSPAQGGECTSALWKNIYKTVVHWTDEGTSRIGGKHSSIQRCDTSWWIVNQSKERWLCRQIPITDSRCCRDGNPREVQKSWYYTVLAPSPSQRRGGCCLLLFYL